MESVRITTKFVSSNPTQARCIRYGTMIKFVSDLRQVGSFSPGTPVSSINKTAATILTEILLTVALNTIITLPPPLAMI